MHSSKMHKSTAEPIDMNIPNLSDPEEKKVKVSKSNRDIKTESEDSNKHTRIEPDNIVPSVSHTKLETKDSTFPYKKYSTGDLKRSMQNPPSLPPLRPSDDHAVLFNFNTVPGCVQSPYPQTYTDKWDNFHVRLPCSPQSLSPDKKNLFGKYKMQSRWGMIQSALSNPIQSTIDLEKRILTYNSEHSKQWDFNSLHKTFTKALEPREIDEFFNKVLPKMIDLCLQTPNICTQPIPLLKAGMNFQITLSQKQIACLLANAFFCTFPQRNIGYVSSEYFTYPSINFNALYSKGGSCTKIEKMKCLINYFRRVTENEPTGVVTFHRRCIEQFPEWRDSEKLLSNLCVQSEGQIEVDGMGMLQVDFADEYIGGLVLEPACAQEEIRFLFCPELIVSRLFTERLEKNEAMIITGCEQFNKYTGYEHSFRWDGNFEDCIPTDSWGRKLTQVVAIDAIPFVHHMEQYNPELIQRELEKAFAGFSERGDGKSDLPAVATGNWGCGVFCGDPRLKALIQLISASEAGRDVFYLTFNDKQLEEDLQKMFHFLKSKNFKVGQLVRNLEDFYEQVVKTEGKESLYSYLFRRGTESD